MPPQEPIKPPAWQREHQQTVLRICILIAARLQKGESISRCVRRYSKRWNGKPFECDPSRKFQLSQETIRRAFWKWRRGGEVASAVALQYQPAIASKVTAPVLRSFITALFLPSVRSCVEAFRLLEARRRRAGHLPGTGRGRRAKAKSLDGVCYSTLLRHLPTGLARRIRSARRAAAEAERALSQLRFAIESQALATLPPKRKRPTKPISFEI
jgi:hypothetical protein